MPSPNGLTLDDAGVLAFGGVTGFVGGVFGEGAGLCMTDVCDFGPILVFLVGGTDVDDALEWLIESLSDEMIVGSRDDCDDVAVDEVVDGDLDLFPMGCRTNQIRGI